MHKARTDRSRQRALLLGALALAIPTGMVFSLRADDQASRGGKEPTKLAKDLIGTWILVGTPDKIGEMPKSGGRLKFITGRHWVVTQAEPETGKVLFHHGGTYTLDGDHYAETVEYANENTADLIKKTFKFKIK